MTRIAYLVTSARVMTLADWEDFLAGLLDTARDDRTVAAG